MLSPLVITSLVNIVVLVGEHAAVAYAVAPDVLAAMSLDGWYWADCHLDGHTLLHVYTVAPLPFDTFPHSAAFWPAYHALAALQRGGSFMPMFQFSEN